MIEDLVFYTGLSFLIAHELDAVNRHEWKMFPGLSGLADQKGYRLFVLLHVPLLVVIFWLMFHPDRGVRYAFQAIMDVFFIVHAGLHYLLRRHEHNGFTKRFSLLLIGLCSLAGAVHLMLLFAGV
ncbi:DUF6713 family protein [Prosthecochloris sp.]|uniref:DUF6713 family protein n=1 Tax=Prosthecochloris sp. TaxID=290513 RepID=UPI00257E8EA7|nr:DUF6713 family protein [Prosthecochloris sp.]